MQVQELLQKMGNGAGQNVGMTDYTIYLYNGIPTYTPVGLYHFRRGSAVISLAFSEVSTAVSVRPSEPCRSEPLPRAVM